MKGTCITNIVGELTSYNLENIYYSLFEQPPMSYYSDYPSCHYDDLDELKKIPVEKFPKGLEKFFEVDENGNPTGIYNWDYFIELLERISGHDITEISEKSDYFHTSPIHEFFTATPMHVLNILTNMDNILDLYSSLIEDLDLNCPKRLRENPDIIYGFFLTTDQLLAEYCFDFMSDELKTNKEFLRRLFKLSSVQENNMIVDKIKPELFENDDEFAKKMIECWGILPFISYWDKFSHLWDEVAPTMSDEQFEQAEEYYWEIEKIPELAKKYNEKYDKRFDSEEIEDEFDDEDERDEDSELTNQDEDVLAVMRIAVGKAINNTPEINQQLNESKNDNDSNDNRDSI